MEQLTSTLKLDEGPDSKDCVLVVRNGQLIRTHPSSLSNVQKQALQTSVIGLSKGAKDAHSAAATLKSMTRMAFLQFCPDKRRSNICCRYFSNTIMSTFGTAEERTDSEKPACERTH